MPSFQTNGARTNTVGGKNVVLRQMNQHYQALADMKPHIDTNEPATRIRYNKLKSPPRKKQKHNKKKKSLNSPLGYKKAAKPKDILTKTVNAVKRIRKEETTFNKPSKTSTDLSEKFIARRMRKNKREMKEHQRTLDKISNTISNLDKQSIHDRKHNRFDPIAYPVTLLRRDLQGHNPMPCLSDSSKNLGRLKCYTDFETRENLRKKYANQKPSFQLQRSCIRYGNTAPISSRKHSCPNTPLRPQSARLNSNNTRKRIKRPQSARKLCKKRPQSAKNNRRKVMRSFTYNENESSINNQSNTEALQLKNQIMSEIIQHKIFAQEKLIEFFKSKLSENEPNDHLTAIIEALCHEFHVP
eukprot:209738_1